MLKSREADCRTAMLLFATSANSLTTVADNQPGIHGAFLKSHLNSAIRLAELLSLGKCLPADGSGPASNFVTHVHGFC